MRGAMKFAYADPPYLGMGKKHYKNHHDEAAIWDDPKSHQRLVDRLVDEFPDGWAMSLSSTSLYVILPMCPNDVRVMAWVKPFSVFKPNVGLSYSWEPVIFRGGRRITRDQPTVRDWVSENITLKKGLVGAKPPRFCSWILSTLNYQEGDEVVDLFPGTGVMSDVVSRFTGGEIGGILKRGR